MLCFFFHSLTSATTSRGRRRRTSRNSIYLTRFKGLHVLDFHHDQKALLLQCRYLVQQCIVRSLGHDFRVAHVASSSSSSSCCCCSAATAATARLPLSRVLVLVVVVGGGEVEPNHSTAKSHSKDVEIRSNFLGINGRGSGRAGGGKGCENGHFMA